MTTNLPEFNYVGFWRRVWATIIDSVLLMALIYPILIWIYGWDYFERSALIVGWADFIILWILPAVIWVFLWVKYQATPGKLAIGARIVNSRTGHPASIGQYIVRYFGYYISIIFLGIGYLWVAFDKRCQGWHDKIAGTVVIFKPSDLTVEKRNEVDA